MHAQFGSRQPLSTGSRQSHHHSRGDAAALQRHRALHQQAARPQPPQQPQGLPLSRSSSSSTAAHALVQPHQTAAPGAPEQLPLPQQHVEQQPHQQQQQHAQQQQKLLRHAQQVQQQQQQAPIRPAHAQQHVQHMTRLVRSCDSVLKLQAVLSIHLHQFTPSCIATAMQQLAMLRHRDKQHVQQGTSSGSRADLGPVLQAVQLQLAGQLTQALLKQLPVVSGSCLATFLVAATAMRLVVPGPVLEQLAAHLVHKALRLACQQHQQDTQTGHTGGSMPQAQQQELQQQQQPDSDSQPPQLQPHQRQHVAAVSAWALAKLRLESAPLWSELCSIAGEQLPHMSPHDCVLLAYALARARQPEPRLFRALQQQLSPHAAQLSPDSISCLLWSTAAAGEYHHAWVSALVAAAADKMERFSPRHLATSLWACGRLRHADARMLSALRVQALACMPDMQPQSLCNLAWSLATLGVADEALTQAAISRAHQLVEGLSVQGLANMAWAVVKLQQQLRTNAAAAPAAAVLAAPRQHHRAAASSILLGYRQAQPGEQCVVLQSAHELLTAICTAAESRLGAAKPQEVCNLLWACATLKHRHEPFFEAAAVRLAAVAEDAQPIDLSQALWALHTLRFNRSSTQQALLLSALRKLHTFGPQALSNLAWAVASSSMRYDPGLPAAVAQQLQSLLPHMAPQGLATTLWALGKMGHTPQQLIHAASSRIRQQLPLFNAQDLCNVAMVVAKAGYREPQLLQALAAAAGSAAAATLGAASSSSSSSGSSSSGSSSSGSNSSGSRSSSGSSSPAVGGSVVAAHAGQIGLSSGVGGLGEASASVQHSKHHQRLTWQGVCNLVWAFAGAGWCDSVLLQQLQQLAVLHLPRLQPRNIAALCQGLSLLGEPLHADGGLLAALPDALRAQQHRQQRRRGNSSRGPQPWNQQGQLDHQQPQQQQQQQSDVQTLVELLQDWPADSLALLLQAVAVANAQDSCPDLVLAVLMLLNRAPADALSAHRYSQLHLALTHIALQWDVAAAASWGAAAPPAAADTQLLAAGLLTGKLAQRCLRNWQQQEADRQLTRVEQEVAAVLRGMGVQPVLQHWLPLSCSQQQQHSRRALAVRLGLPESVLGPGRSPVALCVLAPAALSSSWPRKVLGQTALEHSCLQSAGWQVACLSWEVWDRLAGDVRQQRGLLQQLCGL